MLNSRLLKKIAPVLFIITTVITIGSCAKKDPVIAVVNGTEITVTAVERRVESMRQQYRAQGSDIPAEDLADVRTQILDGMIEAMLLVKEAERLEIEGSEVEAAQQVEAIRGQFDSEETYSEALNAQGFTPQSLLNEIIDSLTIDKLLESVAFDGLVVTDEESEQFYAENPDIFAVPESIEASHILISVGPDASDEEVEKAQAKIKTVQDSLNAGTDFADIARLMSEGPSASNGGSLGSFSRGQMVPEFEEVAFSLEPGELSEPVRTSFGFHIIKVTGYNAPSAVPYEEVKAQITDYLTGTKRDETVTSYVAELRNNAAIEIFEFPEPEEEKAE